MRHDPERAESFGNRASNFASPCRISIKLCSERQARSLHVLRRGKNGTPFCCERHALRQSIEQAHPQDFLKTLNPPYDRR